MDTERRSLAEDLTDAVRAREDAREAAASQALEELQREHKALSSRRRRLHASIDLLEGLDVLKADAAARLELYRNTEQDVSRRRAEVYRRIGELRGEQRLHADRG
jgi:hypothetical protein